MSFPFIAMKFNGVVDIHVSVQQVSRIFFNAKLKLYVVKTSPALPSTLITLILLSVSVNLTLLGTRSICPFMTGLFHFAQRPHSLSMQEQVSAWPSCLWLSNIPHPAQSTWHLSSHLWIGPLVLCEISGLSQVKHSLVFVFLGHILAFPCAWW